MRGLAPCRAESRLSLITQLYRNGPIPLGTSLVGPGGNFLEAALLVRHSEYHFHLVHVDLPGNERKHRLYRC